MFDNPFCIILITCDILWNSYNITKKWRNLWHILETYVPKKTFSRCHILKKTLALIAISSNWPHPECNLSYAAKRKLHLLLSFQNIWNGPYLEWTFLEVIITGKSSLLKEGKVFGYYLLHFWIDVRRFWLKWWNLYYNVKRGWISKI